MQVQTRFRSTTSRPFIGKTNEDTLEFVLSRQRSYFESIFPQLVVKGKLVQENEQKVLVLKFLPGLETTLVLMALVIVVGYSFFDVLYFKSGIKLSELIAFGVIVIPMLLILAIYLEFDKTKSKICKLLEINAKNVK